MKRILTYCMALMVMSISCKKSEVDNGLDTSKAIQVNNVAYGSDPLQKMDVHLPAGRNEGNTKALIILHGGAWITGDKMDMNEAVASFKTLLPDYAIFNINYRLATFQPSNVWPTQMDDVNAAVSFINNKSREYQFNKDKMAIGGASAGAHLSLLKAYKHNNGNIKAVVNMFGPTEMADLYVYNSSYQVMLNTFMSGSPASNPGNYHNASPLYFVNSNSVPTIILHGTLDYVVPIRQSDSLDNRLAAAGVPKQYIKYTGESHGIWSASNTQDAYTKVAAFLKQHVQ